jgi:hypothetical protein
MKNTTKFNLTFRTVTIGEHFISSGAIFKKKSTRTAALVSTGRVFYFGQYDSCIVGW